MENFRKLCRNLQDMFPEVSPQSPREVRQIVAVGRVLSGEDVGGVCFGLKLQRRNIDAFVDEVGRRGLGGIISYEELTAEAAVAGRRLGIAQILLGVLAERRFEELSDEITGAGVLRIEDHRPSRTDTDYRLLNGQGNPICRLNIKFHGTFFRDARRYVGLEPDDCFALATYKINNAVRR